MKKILIRLLWVLLALAGAWAYATLALLQSPSMAAAAA